MEREEWRGSEEEDVCQECEQPGTAGAGDMVWRWATEEGGTEGFTEKQF